MLVAGWWTRRADEDVRPYKVSFWRTSFPPVLAVPLLVFLTPVLAHVTHAHTTVAGISCGAWSIVPSPKSGTATSYLYGVASTSDRDVWAVGYHPNQTDENWKTLIRHWNGTRWSAVASPNVGPDGRARAQGGRLYAVSALSVTNAWAVGEGPMIEHWNGVTWRVVPSPQPSNDSREPARLLSVTALAADNVWAVGLNWRAPNLTLIEHWNGHRWSIVPGPGTGHLALAGIAAVSDHDIWAVGAGGSGINQTAIEHWNGSQWTLEPALGDGLAAVAAISPRDVWALGGGTIEHWNGSQWSLVASPSPGTPLSALTGIAALSSTDVWAVGWAGRTVPGDGYAEHALIEHWNGSGWSLAAAPAAGSPDSQLLGVTAVSSQTLWAAGFAGKHRTSGNHTLIEHYTRC
jgi:hypothetical protein